MMSISWKERREVIYGVIGSFYLFYIQNNTPCELYCYLPGLRLDDEPLGVGTVEEMKALAEQHLSSWLALMNLLRSGGGKTRPLKWRIIYNRERVHSLWGYTPTYNDQAYMYVGYLGPFKVVSLRAEYSGPGTYPYYFDGSSLPGISDDTNIKPGSAKTMMPAVEKVFSAWLLKLNQTIAGATVKKADNS